MSDDEPTSPTDAQPAVEDDQTQATDESPDGALGVETPDDGGDSEDVALGSDRGLFGVDASTDAELSRGLEALLFSTQHPLTAGRLAELLSLPSTKPVRGAIRVLNQSYESTGRSFRIEQVAGGYQMLTLPELGELVKKLVAKEQDAK